MVAARKAILTIRHWHNHEKAAHLQKVRGDLVVNLKDDMTNVFRLGAVQIS